MNIPAAFREPAPLRLSLTSTGSKEAVVAALRRAITEQRYSVPDGYAHGFWRINGTVTGRMISITARPHVIPGLPAGYGALPLTFDGTVEEGPNGALVMGHLSAPIPPYFAAVVGAGLLGFGVLAALMMGAFGILIALVFGSLFAVMGAAITRHNQRSSLKWHAAEVGRFLATIVADASKAGEVIGS